MQAADDSLVHEILDILHRFAMGVIEHGALMNVSLKPDVQKLIDERVNSGKYSSPEEVVEAAVLALDQLENFGDFEAGELARFLAEGEQRRTGKWPQ